MESLAIRWMCGEDMAPVSAISKESGLDIPLKKMVRSASLICIVAEQQGLIKGFAFYKLKKDKIEMVCLAVDLKFRRCGFATELVSRIVSKMDSKRNVLETRVSEYNLEAQLFLKSLNFKAEESVIAGDETNYVFRRLLGA
jgi:ribosomal protein S18 acetylase RimI-like enzyme